MIEWGEEFLNVRTAPTPLRPAEDLHPVPIVGEDWGAFAADANSNTITLQKIINGCQSQGGGIVYFPPGRYYLGRNGGAVPFSPGFAVDAADIVAYPYVTLRFAPGAMLVPLNFSEAGTFSRTMEGRPDETPLVIIEIQGEIEADPRPIFDTAVRPDSANEPTSLLAGMILLTGNRVRAIHPEWWNTTTADEGVRNLRAFQAAIDAAHTNRRRPMRDVSGRLRRDAAVDVMWWQRPSVPVIATGTYPIEAGLEVGVRSNHTDAGNDPALLTPNTAPFVLQGAREVGNAGQGATTLMRGRAPTVGAPDDDVPMLSIRGVPECALRDLGFDGAQRTKILVEIAPGGGVGHAEFSNCAFTKVGYVSGATLVRISDASKTRTDVRDTSRARSNLAFTRCRFQTNPLGLVIPASNPLRRVRGVELNVSDDVNVEFRSCVFASEAAPMIDALRGRFTLNECMLHTRRCARDQVASSSNGTDVEIHAPVQVDGVVDAPASFTCREVESQSFQFLTTFSGEARPSTGRTAQVRPTGSRSACVFINLHHGASVSGGVEPTPVDWRETRASVSWDGPGYLSSDLIMVGCRGRTSYSNRDGSSSSGTLGVVRVGPNIAGRIYNIGNLTFDPDPAAVVASGRIVPANFIVPYDASVTLRRVLQLGAIELHPR